MGSFSVGERNQMLDAIANRASYTATPFWLQLHTADPGAAGTTAVGANTTRVQASFSAAASGSITNSADVVFGPLASAETITHVSAWSASTGGNFKGSDDIVSTPVLVNDSIRIAAGQLTLALS